MKVKLTKLADNQPIIIEVPFPEPPVLSTGAIVEGEYGATITWTPDEKVADALKKQRKYQPQLTGGSPYTISGGPNDGAKCVQFSGGINIGYNNRPDLAQLYQYCVDYGKVMEEARSAYWTEERKIQQSEDAKLIAEADAKAVVLRASIGSDDIEVVATKTGNWDGYDTYKYTVDDTEINWQDVKVVGHASATRPGALGSFYNVKICKISSDKLADIRVAQAQADLEKKAAIEKQKAAEAADPVPQAAYDAWERYGGSAEKAWKQEDEYACALLNRYGYRIGISPEELDLARRECAAEE